MMNNEIRIWPIIGSALGFAVLMWCAFGFVSFMADVFARLGVAG